MYIVFSNLYPPDTDVCLICCYEIINKKKLGRVLFTLIFSFWVWSSCEILMISERMILISLSVISEQGSAQIIHRTAARKPKITEVSVEEWCLANTRIMDLLIAKSPQVITDYMLHTMKVCELFKYYERLSVLQFDREYRHMQAHQWSSWGTDTPHLHTLHLRLKAASSEGTAQVAAPQQ